MLLPGTSLHTSSVTSKSVGVDSRSAAETVTVLSEMDPEETESTGTLNSSVSVAPVDSQGMPIPPPDERMLSKAADSRAAQTLYRHGGKGNVLVVCPWYCLPHFRDVTTAAVSLHHSAELMLLLRIMNLELKPRTLFNLTLLYGRSKPFALYR